MYRGDCAKDEHGAAAVYQELGANPTSVQGLNNCLAYGSLLGSSRTTADAIKAYGSLKLFMGILTLADSGRRASKGFISELGGCEVAEFPGNFWFKESGLLLNIRR